ncbi:adenylate/guanylate cyclase domain-containing protein [Lutimaribacter marinistellae]|uniref:Adenylate/guanylate cyclase domain-containing protein n=1 Tax=Lutimaribacter marinistellae TaxID=1820329 RepID=A0ABV7TDW9_9RHOB
MERRLTTILAADVAGYSRLMEADEQGTYDALQVLLSETVMPRIGESGGRVFKLMGDGLLAEFPSVVDAVSCALKIQSDMARHHPIALRIGIHLGDVIAEGDDLHGDGVNIAARLESLAEPGAVLVSKQVHDHVEPRLGIGWRDMGAQQVKNISRPVHVLRAEPQASGAAPPRPAPKRLIAASLAVLCVGLAAILWQPWRASPTAPEPAVRQAALLPSLAVLPFDSLSASGEEDYLADGITDDLITDLAKVSGLLVIARESSFAYRDNAIDLSTVATQLGVRYIVTGSLRRAGDRIRINAQLVDTDTGAHVWAERYDRKVADIFELQDDVRSRITAALKVELTPEEAEKLSRTMTENTEAYDAYLRARQQESFFTRDSTRAAIRLYHEALEHDPDFVTAKARLATAYTMAVESGWTEEPTTALELARSLAREAIAKDRNLPLAYWALARVYTRKEFFDGEEALDSLRQAIAIDPNYADGHAMLANTLHLMGRAEEGLAHIETAMRLNPHFPFWYFYALGANQFHLTRYEAAEESFLKSIKRNSRWRPNHIYVVSTYGHLGRTDDAEWEMEELRTLGFEPTFETFSAFQRFQDNAYRDHFLDGLRKAGVPGADP